MKKKKMEFSKKIFAGVTVGVIIVSVFTMYMIFKTSDMSALSYLLGGVFAEFATATGFYYNKSKQENLIKLKKQGILNEDVLGTMNNEQNNNELNGGI